MGSLFTRWLLGKTSKVFKRTRSMLADSHPMLTALTSILSIFVFAQKQPLLSAGLVFCTQLGMIFLVQAAA